MYDLVIIGAGPGGIALAAEARAAGIDSNQILLLEKAQHHNSAIRQLYPEQKLTTANYKGFEAKCDGLLCIRDMNKAETIEYFDKVIADYNLNIEYGADVFGMERTNVNDARFSINSSKGSYESRVLGVGIAFNDDGPIFDETGATNVPGLYLLGDLVVGKKGGSIITAFNSAVRAMKHICAHELPCK